MPKPPQAVFDSIYAFPPNRDTLGGTAYFIVGNSINPADSADHNGLPANSSNSSVPSAHQPTGFKQPTDDPTQSVDGLTNPTDPSDHQPAHRLPGNILIDCPPWHEETADFLAQHGGVRWWIFTHRSSFGPLQTVRALHRAFSTPATTLEEGEPAAQSAAARCELVVQEQEAYLLPNLPVTTFREEVTLSPELRVIWTPGHTPGSACVWLDRAGGILFSGRHLLPTPQGELMPLKTAKTFHWFRQLRSVQALIDRFSPARLAHCCPGASVGFLRGALSVDRAYERLTTLNLAAARLDPVALQSPSLSETPDQ